MRAATAESMGVASEIAVPFDEHKVQVSLDQWRKLIRSDLSHAIVVTDALTSHWF